MTRPPIIITRTQDEQDQIDILDDRAEYQKMKFLFFPIIIAGTLIFGVAMGIQGAIIGFLACSGVAFVLLSRAWLWKNESEDKYQARRRFR